MAKAVWNHGIIDLMWFPLLLASAGLMFEIGDTYQLSWMRLLAFSIPFAGMIVLIAVSGRRFPRLAACQSIALMSMLTATFWVWSSRQSDGFEWWFNNELSLSLNFILNSIVFLGFLIFAFTVVINSCFVNNKTKQNGDNFGNFFTT